MFVKRYHIRVGATTTAGGVVKASSSFSSLNGARLALEGDPVDCPACGAQGVIKCVMPRLADRFGTKEYALSDDLCICGCNPPPKLIADQSFKYQSILYADENAAANATVGHTGNAAEVVPPHAESTKQADLRPLRFVIRETGKPHANRPYQLGLVDGTVVQGTTDADGASRQLSPDERAALRTWRGGQ